MVNINDRKFNYEKDGKASFVNSDDCIIYARCDHDGYKWWNTWWDGPSKKSIDNLSAVGEEISEIMFDLFDMLKNGVSDIRYMMDNNLAEPLSRDECNLYIYGEHANYWARFIARNKDYNIYLKAYKKTEQAG